MKLFVHIPQKAGIRKLVRVNYKIFDGCIFDCASVDDAIEFLKVRRPEGRIIAKLSSPDERSFALLYDFVDSFIIGGFTDDLVSCVDPLINLRMFNDEYKEIYLDIQDDMPLVELDELLSYSMLSNIDGIVLGKPRLLQYTADRSKGILEIFADDVGSEEEMGRAMSDGATAVAVKSGKCLCKATSTGKKLRKMIA